MISIIICSRKKQIDISIENNIRETIGNVTYEIVWIDNSSNKMSICNAYNEGVRKAKYQFLCFMHEDVAFLSKKWGELSIKEMQNDKVKLLGLIGTKYLDASSTYWYPSISCCGHNWVGKYKKCFSDNLDTQEVVAVDGLWLFMRKSIFCNGIRWDEDTYKGFDMYDLDISMQVNMIDKCQESIKIIGNIDVDHKSDGNYSERFFEACKLFHQKWDAYLPISVIPINEAIVKQSQSLALERICKLEIERAKNANMNKNIIYRIANKIYRIIYH